jgi:hypothetical protein
MRVADLIEALTKIDRNAIVIMSSDGEGNSYSPLAGLSKVLYEAESTWSGNIVDEGDVCRQFCYDTYPDDEDEEELCSEHCIEFPESVLDSVEGAEHAIALWPTN